MGLPEDVGYSEAHGSAPLITIYGHITLDSTPWRLMAAHCGLKTKAWQKKAEAAKLDAEAATKVPRGLISLSRMSRVHVWGRGPGQGV